MSTGKLTDRHPLIKMCGITTLDDARGAVNAGADLLGMVFYPRSPRAVTFEMARRIAEVARETPRPSHARSQEPVRIVAVFVNPPEELVEGVVARAAPDVLQFHGEETVATCKAHQRPYMKAHRLAGERDVARIRDYLDAPAIGYLIDAFSRHAHGGTGRLLPEPLMAAGLREPGGFLAGGLTPGNIGRLIEHFRPHGVDVSSGIETRPGRKSGRLMKAFVQAVTSAGPE